MSNVLKWFSSVIVFNIVLIVWLGFAENSNESLMLWARHTARISFAYFLLSFSASSLHYFFSNTLTKFIRHQRRYIGLSFALAHTIHLVALTSFFIVMEENPGIVTLIGGGLGYVLVYAMALTSNDNAVKKLGLKRWKQIHWFGANYIAVIFAFTYVGKLLDGQPNGSDYDYLTFTLMVGVIFMVFILRLIYFLKSKNSQVQSET
jgi:DMSO/TMAO reductase YedYZ heme-binding membrane subunit